MEGLCGGRQHQTTQSTERWVHHTVLPWPDSSGTGGDVRQTLGETAGRPHSFLPRHNLLLITNLFPSLILNQAQPWFHQLVAIMTFKSQIFLRFSLSRKYRSAVVLPIPPNVFVPNLNFGFTCCGSTAPHLAKSPGAGKRYSTYAPSLLKTPQTENIRCELSS